jgi:transcriptional regulator with XRE-family HTH domain
MEINFKESLKKLRREKNISQETLAKYLCITQQSVGKWERGEGFPDITLLPKIALYFNVSIDDLLNVGQARADEKLKEYEQEASLSNSLLQLTQGSDLLQSLLPS